MFKVNGDYLNLQGSYLFSDIAKKVTRIINLRGTFSV